MSRIGPSEENRFLDLAVDRALSPVPLRELVLEAATVLEIAPRSAGRLAAALGELLGRAHREGLTGRLSLHAASGRGDRWLLARLRLAEPAEAGAVAMPALPLQGLDLCTWRERRPALEATLGVRRRRAAPVDAALISALRARFAARLGGGMPLRAVEDGPVRGRRSDRNRLELVLETALEELRRGGPPFCLALFAADPLTGDGRAADARLRRRAERAILRALPAWLAAGDRIEGFRGRVHAVRMTATELEEALARARRWSVLLRALPLGPGTRAAACFGVARAFADDTAASLLQRASRALVRARQRGPGRVEAGRGDEERLARLRAETVPAGGRGA